MKLLFLALNFKGYGETTLGIHLAHTLRDAGHHPTFLAPSNMSALLKGAAVPYRTYPLTSMREAIGGALDAAIAADKPDVLVLSDYMTSTAVLDDAGCKAQILGYGIPIVAIDTWDLTVTGFVMDMVGRGAKPIPDWREALHLKLIPAPVASPRPGETFYSFLPASARQGAKVRRHVRRGLGLGEDDRVVLYCSARWQYATMPDDAANQAQNMPVVLGHYVSELGPRVRIVHVGPRAYSLPTSQYLWLPSLAPQDFEHLLGSADALLTLNAASSTVARALSSDIPVVIVANSHRVRSIEEADCVSPNMSPAFRQVVQGLLPLYPYYMWPFGFHAFLTPLFNDTAFRRQLQWCELLDDASTVATLRGVLLDSAFRDRVLAAQGEYVTALRALESPAWAIERAVGSVAAS